MTSAIYTSKARPNTRPRSPAQSGMTLIELMVAVAIGAFLMIGAMTVFMQSRTTFRITESLSRLQENARFALEALEADVRMAQYWGFVSRSELILGRRDPTQPPGIGPATCGQNWTINLNQAVQGTNNSYGWACAGQAPVEVNSDTLVVRHAGDDVITPPNLAGQMAIVTSRYNGTLFNTAAVPAGYDVAGGFAQVHRLMVNGYYVRRAAGAGPAAVPPALRRKTLQTDGTIADEEVMSGVEDMQVQFGIDTDAPGTANRGSVDRYVNPNDPIIDPTNAAFNPNVEILAVRVWLRVRAELPENGFVDQTNYVYADQNIPPIGDAFRRVLVSKTIYLRNTRPPDY
jgi:type IV pilus assembly protein PilW